MPLQRLFGQPLEGSHSMLRHSSVRAPPRCAYPEPIAGLVARLVRSLVRRRITWPTFSARRCQRATKKDISVACRDLVSAAALRRSGVGTDDANTFSALRWRRESGRDGPG